VLYSEATKFPAGLVLDPDRFHKNEP
jgi:hypothetical protein